MAAIPTTPDNKNLTLVLGGYQSAKFVPKNADGSITDLTGLNAATFYIAGDYLALGYGGGDSATCVIVDADETGVTLGFDATLVTAVQTLLGAVRGAYKILGTDGTDTWNVGFGQVQAQFTGFN